MNLLANPIVVRMALLFVVAVFAFVMAVVVMRRLRRKLASEVMPIEVVSLDSMPVNAAVVIQELKQQKHELQTQQQAERRRAKASENISVAVLAHLSSGVLFVGQNGLVRQANVAARQILGVAAPVGMGLAEVFREASPFESNGDSRTLAETVQTCLREKRPARNLPIRYLTPQGDERILDVTVTSVHAASGEALGAACLINDQTELERIRRQQQLSGELSAEMALALRNSLTTISSCARQLAETGEAASAQRLAADIASEAAHLDHTIGGFLARAKAVGS